MKENKAYLHVDEKIGERIFMKVTEKITRKSSLERDR